MGWQNSRSHEIARTLQPPGLAEDLAEQVQNDGAVKMKAITVWQPWASLLARNLKLFETRSWATNYRGPIAIHAAALTIPQVLKKLFPLGAWDYHPDYQAKKAFLDVVTEALNPYTLEGLPLGAVVATAELVGCHKIVRHGGRGMSARGPGWLETGIGIYEPTERELMFGDWAPGRYAWEFKDMKLVTPVPAKGKQGLWEWNV